MSMSRETIACVSPNNLDQNKGFLFDNSDKKIEIKINTSQFEFDSTGAIKIKEGVIPVIDPESHTTTVGEYVTNVQVESTNPTNLQLFTKIDNSNAEAHTKSINLEPTVTEISAINNFIATVDPVKNTLNISLDQGQNSHKHTHSINNGVSVNLPTVTVFEHSSKSNFITVQENSMHPTTKELYVPVPDVKLTDAFGNVIGYVYSEEQVTRINNHTII